MWNQEAQAINYLECQAGFNLLRQCLCDDAVKLRQHLHGQLRVDAFGANQIVQRICQRTTQAV